MCAHAYIGFLIGIQLQYLILCVHVCVCVYANMCAHAYVVLLSAFHLHNCVNAQLPFHSCWSWTTLLPVSMLFIKSIAI